MKKSREKTRLVKQPHGGALKQGNTVGVGRPTDEFKAMCRELVTREATWEEVKAILEKRDHPHYMSALKWAAEQGYGKPTESIELTGKDGGPVQVQEWSFGKRKVTF